MEVSSLPSPPIDDGNANPRLKATVATVNWNRLASLACSIYCATSSRWGDQFLGGSNVVRFLHLDDANHSVLVVRVPYRPEDGWTEQNIKAFAPRMSSEVATMRYLMTHTTIPVPRIIHHTGEADGDGVGSPYMIMTKIDGVPLDYVWHDMEDAKRENVLRQVVDILLELASHRFDKIGSLFQREGDSTAKEAWYVAPMVKDPDDTNITKAMSSVTFTSIIDYWVARANANLESIRNRDFGSEMKAYDYYQAWFMRSLIPALYDPSLDVTGFPLCHGDFHSQNIMIIDADTLPRISGVIDWEFSFTDGTSTFAQYPHFIVDHLDWEDDNPLRLRNVRDQVTFDVLMREAEMKKDPTGGLPLSRAFANCQGTYLFEQAICDRDRFPIVYSLLFAHIYGEDEDLYTENLYYSSLTKHGILRKEAKQFEKETEVRNEAVEILGEELVSRGISNENFRGVVRKYLDRFPEPGLVREWLTTQDALGQGQ